jgi:hypothetical protein
VTQTFTATKTPTVTPTPTATKTPTLIPFPTKTVTPGSSAVTPTQTWTPNPRAGSTGDPCRTSAGKIPLPISLTSSMLLVPGVPGQRIYVCGVVGFFAGTSYTFEASSPGGACRIGTALPTPLPTAIGLTGAMLTDLQLATGGTIFSTPPGASLCVVLTGSSLSLQGSLTFIQGP